MGTDRIRKAALFSLVFHTAYSAYHIILGITAHSWWFLTVGVYYVIVSGVRFFVFQSKMRGRVALLFAGIMLMVLSLPLVGTVILSVIEDRGKAFPLVVMLAIAVYAFTKITLAIVNRVKVRRSRSAKLTALRNISLADAFVSIFSLQRSMLVSFEGMTETEIRIMNAATGASVCIIVFLLGLNLICSKKHFGTGNPAVL